MKLVQNWLVNSWSKLDVSRWKLRYSVIRGHVKL